DAAATENSQPLSTTARNKGIECPNTTSQRLANGHTSEWQGCRTIDRHRPSCGVWTKRIQRLACAVDHSPQQFHANANGRPASGRDDAIAIANAMRKLQGHRQHHRSTEADNFAGIRYTATGHNLAGIAHGAERSFRLHQVADDLEHTPAPTQGADAFQFAEVWCKRCRH